jgi:hypothetical protein
MKGKLFLWLEQVLKSVFFFTLIVLFNVCSEKSDPSPNKCPKSTGETYFSGEIDSECLLVEPGLNNYQALFRFWGLWKTKCFALHGTAFSDLKYAPIYQFGITIPTSGITCEIKSDDAVSTGEYQFFKDFNPQNPKEAFVWFIIDNTEYGSHFGDQDADAYFEVTKVEDIPPWSGGLEGNPTFFKVVSGRTTCRLFPFEGDAEPIDLKDVEF